jgi:hypothetical protein
MMADEIEGIPHYDAHFRILKPPEVQELSENI